MEQSDTLSSLWADLHHTLALDGQLTDDHLKIREVEQVGDSVHEDIQRLLEQMSVHIDTTRFPRVIIANTRTAFYGRGIIFLSETDIDASTVDPFSSGEEGMHWVHDEINNNGRGWPKEKLGNILEASGDIQWREFIGALGPMILHDAVSEEERCHRFPKGIPVPPSLQAVTKHIHDLHSKYEHYKREKPCSFEGFQCATKLQEFTSHYPANNYAYLLDRRTIKDWDAVLRMTSDQGISRFFCDASDSEE